MADYDETYIFSSLTTSTSDFTYLGPDFSGLQVKDTDGAWCWTDSGSVSTGTGPPSGIDCVYTETSSPVAVDDVFTMTLTNDINASSYGFFIDLDMYLYSQTGGDVYFEAYNGSTWDIVGSFGYSISVSLVSTTFDCSSYSNSDFKIRFRIVVGGTSYDNDFAVKEIRIYGDAKEVSTREINNIQSIQGIQSITM